MLWRVRSPATIETIPYRKIHVNSFLQKFQIFRTTLWKTNYVVSIPRF